MFNRSTKEKKEKMRSEGILNTIFNEDCLITMSRIESGTVDLILQDPPYGTTGKRQPLKIHEDVVVFGKGTCRYNPIKRKGVYRAKGGITDKHGTFNGAGSEITFNDEYYPESIIDFSGAGMRSDRIHPTEKPIDLMRYMIQTYTQEGEIVFDGYMGSGTTAHACITEKRNYIGSEMNEQFYKLLNERLEREYSQPKLF
jgi:site-specific DNA-methyltransferase (adenine-specific)